MSLITCNACNHTFDSDFYDCCPICQKLEDEYYEEATEC